MSNTDESRKEFESWLYSKDGANSIKVSEKYLTNDQQLRWEAWQASRAKPIKLPNVIHDRDDYVSNAIDLYKEAIEEAGHRCE